MNSDRCFPTLFSTPHPDGLIEHVLPAYGLPQPLRCELHRAGRNDHYRVCAGDEMYYLKIPAAFHHWQTEDDYRARLASEVALLKHLHHHGIPVPAPVARRDGTYLCTLDAPEGQRYAMLFHAAPGRPLGDRVTLEQVRSVALLAARMHACMDLLPDDFTPINWDLHWIVDVSLENLEPVLGERKADWAYVQDLGAAIREWVEATLPTHKPAYGVIHGDFHQDNILAHEGEQVLVDAESFGRGWRAWEIAYYLSGNFSQWTFDPEVEIERQQRREVFLETYTSGRALGEAELASIPVFGAARHLLAIGRFAALGTRYEGQRAVAEAQVDRWMGFLRAWIEHYRPL
jgi:Ser/Thr protein kinase RdoA (MazF antagonist)